MVMQQSMNTRMLLPCRLRHAAVTTCKLQHIASAACGLLPRLALECGTGLHAASASTGTSHYHLCMCSMKHIEALWFSNVANSLMWWTYVKAFWRAANSICGGAIQFKTTLKGASALMNSALRDLAMPIIAFGLLASAIIAGCIKIFSVRSSLCLCT